MDPAALAAAEPHEEILVQCSMWILPAARNGVTARERAMDLESLLTVVEDHRFTAAGLACLPRDRRRFRIIRLSLFRVPMNSLEMSHPLPLTETILNTTEITNHSRAGPFLT